MNGARGTGQTRAGWIVEDALRERGYARGRTLTRAAAAGGISYPTLCKFLSGDIPKAAHGKFLRFLRAHRIPLRRFKRVIRPTRRPPTRLGRLLMPVLTERGLTISEAARRASMYVGTVWSWIWHRRPPTPDVLEAFLERNKLNMEPFRPLLGPSRAPTPPSRFGAYLDTERRRRKLTWGEFVAVLIQGTGLSYKQIWCWTRRGRTPSPASAERVLAFLEIPESMRTELMAQVKSHMATVAQAREGHQPPAPCRICGRTSPAWQVRGVATYDARTHTFKHGHCRRRLAAWEERRHRRTIPGLTAADCRRFAATPAVEVVCPHPGCGVVRKKVLSRLPALVWTPARRRRRWTRVVCRAGQLQQACAKHVKVDFAERARRGHIGLKVVDPERLLARARRGDRVARQEVARHMQQKKEELLRARKRTPRRTGPTPGRTLGGILRGLGTREFGICQWCGLLVAGHQRKRRFHGPCFEVLRQTPEARQAWRAMVNDPRQRRLRVRHPTLGRWVLRLEKNLTPTGLEGALHAVTRRRWYAGPGRNPTSAMLRLGCAGHIRRRAKQQSDSAIAAVYRVRRQEVTHAVRVFLNRAPADWRLIFPSLSEKAAAVLAQLCALPEPTEERMKRVAADLAERGTPPELTAQLTGVTATEGATTPTTA